MDNGVLNVAIDGAVARVTLNRPEVHNAFDERLIAALTEAFDRLSADASIRAVVVSGEGRSFCAGADLEWIRRAAEYSPEENVADAHAAERMFAAVARCPKVTIARVHGAAAGGGAGLVAACDISLAAESATFAFSEVRLGLTPAVIVPYVLQKVSMGAARALFVTGRRFGATEAYRIGLVQEVVAGDDLDAAVERVLAEVRPASPNAVARAKWLLTEIVGKTPEEAADTTVAAIADVRATEEGREGVRAFLEKRKPSWVSPHPPTPSPSAVGEGETVGRLTDAVIEGEFGRALLRPSPEIAARAKELRRASTVSESALWEMIRGRRIGGAKFHRQHPIGRFIADFFCDEARLIIELDGGVHDTAEQKERDVTREEILKNSEIHILRFTNEDILTRPDTVREAIAAFLSQHHYSTPPPTESTPPLPQRRERGLGGEGSET